jgi:hypothetical protein
MRSLLVLLVASTSLPGTIGCLAGDGDADGQGVALDISWR